MTGWSDGYFTDVQYTRKFYPQTAPSLLAFACLRQGIRPPDLGPGSTYLELGCGQGYSLNLLAAANPAMQFHGIDFHPGQIANAQRTARAVGLNNVTFDDLSFAQMLDLPEGRIPRCDVVVLHGILTWISPENRAHIVRILERHVKPGGLVMASYNTLPGWGPLMPLRQFVKGYFERTSGPAEKRTLEAFRAAKDFADRDVRALGTPQIKAMIEVALKGDPAYLIHEYMNGHFHPLYHADLARELEAARLTFAASVGIADDMISLAAPPAMQATIEAETDPLWRETLLDYSNNRIFRSDVFVRGPNLLSPRERDALLAPLRFNLMKPPSQITFEFKAPIGKIAGDPATYGSVVEALAEGPRTYGDLAQLPRLAKAPPAHLLKVMGLLISAGVTHPPAGAETDNESAKAFNRAILQDLTFENAPPHLAAPAIGAGVAVGFTDLLSLSDAGDGPTDYGALARRSWDLMAPGNKRFVKDGKAVEDQPSHLAEATARIKTFEAEKLPLMRRLGVV